MKTNRPKTLLSFLWKLPRSYRRLAVENYKKNQNKYHCGKKAISRNINDKATALMGAFIWKESPQGHVFWSERYFKLKD